jgi:V/A-type H+/Na+-transporting ATPase subunit I
MSFRPVPTRWFELVTVHKDLPRVLRCLSQTGAAQLEARDDAGDCSLLPDLTEPLKAYRELARRSRHYWPAPVLPDPSSEPLIETLNSARQRLAAWDEQAEAIITEIERLSRQGAELEQLQQALREVGAHLPDLKLLAGAGPRLQARLLLFPDGAKLREFPPLLLVKRWETAAGAYVLCVGAQSDIHEIEAQASALKARLILFPAWLPSTARAARTAIAEQRSSIATETAALQTRLAELSERLQIGTTLGQMALAEWLHQHAPQLQGSERLAWVTGWTSDLQGVAVRRALDTEGVNYILRVSDASRPTDAPLVLSNPPWIRAFEVFAGMLGMPSRNESDPSIILAVIVPVIFGFMFADVGQGLVVCIGGLVLGQRLPPLKVLVPGGVMAMVFGFMFGSAFSREDLIPPLWMHPLDDPITILAVAIGLGVVVLTIGLLLDAVQAHWRGDARSWWGHQAGLIVVYFGVLASVLRIEGLALAALGVGWYVVGAALLAKRSGLSAMARAAGELVERVMQLIVNTISFARVGAFALAHAGLSAAIVSVALTTGRLGYWIILVLGNLLVIALEGLVVGVQTTRLVLFEFFIRFLSAEGRAFKPLPPPDIMSARVPQPTLGTIS